MKKSICLLSNYKYFHHQDLTMLNKLFESEMERLFNLGVTHFLPNFENENNTLIFVDAIKELAEKYPNLNIHVYNFYGTMVILNKHYLKRFYNSTCKMIFYQSKIKNKFYKYKNPSICICHFYSQAFSISISSSEKANTYLAQKSTIYHL